VGQRYGLEHKILSIHREQARPPEEAAVVERLDCSHDIRPRPGNPALEPATRGWKPVAKEISKEHRGVSLLDLRRHPSDGREDVFHPADHGTSVASGTPASTSAAAPRELGYDHSKAGAACCQTISAAKPALPPE
jgi:hypothetical protein